jgi:hypothetical protein
LSGICAATAWGRCVSRDDGSQADVMAKDDESPADELTTMETEAVATFTAAMTTIGPRLKVELDGKDKFRLGADHPEQAVGTRLDAGDWRGRP